MAVARSVVNGKSLEHFGDAFPPVSKGQRAQKLRADADPFGLPDGAEDIFETLEIDAVLAADRSVRLGQKSSGHESESYSPFVDGRSESGQVAGDASAHAEQETVSICAKAAEPLGDAKDGLHRLASFAGVNTDDAAAFKSGRQRFERIVQYDEHPARPGQHLPDPADILRK